MTKVSPRETELHKVIHQKQHGPFEARHAKIFCASVSVRAALHSVKKLRGFWKQEAARFPFPKSPDTVANRVYWFDLDRRAVLRQLPPQLRSCHRGHPGNNNAICGTCSPACKGGGTLERVLQEGERGGAPWPRWPRIIYTCRLLVCCRSFEIFQTSCTYRTSCTS